MFEVVLSASNMIREEIREKVDENIKKAQKNNNVKRKDRKSGKFTFKWKGPYTVSNITVKGL